MKNEEVLKVVKEERNILQTIKRKKANRIGVFLHRIRILKHVIEGNTDGNIYVIGRLGKRRKQLLDNLQEKTV
jgi:hypothetical protein